MAEPKAQAQDEERYGVLLYYKYIEIPDLDELVAFYESNCNSLGLLGRVRLSPNGVNVTVGGKLSLLEKHVAAVRSNSLFEGTDFKLAACDRPLNDKVAEECGFNALSIRVVKELVTLSSHPLLKSPEISNAGIHLSAVEFHSALQSAGQGQFSEKDSPAYNGGLVLLDARNLYETRIGKFNAPNVETLDPGIRQYSDLPSWIDDNSEQLKGKRVLMYCTGGIRCEMASAYIRSKGSGFENVFQIEGALYVCELCLKHGKGVESVASNGNGKTQAEASVVELKTVLSDTKLSSQLAWSHDNRSPRKLRILCLHGFRQNASSFKGRTASLAKKLKNIAELVFVDAPHELPYIYQPCFTGSHGDCTSPSLHQIRPPLTENCKKKFAWLVAPDFSGTSGADWKIADGPFDPFQYQQQTGGFDVSLAYLKAVFSQEGPFDGILGFSQGAAMAALVSAQLERLKGEMDFRFVILCSGFALKLSEFEHQSINCPSLHIFGSDHGEDRQIANQASRDLASLFDDGCCGIIEHDSGHIIPTRSPYIDEIKNFLQRFL
ncbi:rhodanese-like domain-containing protein 6 isoform X2 [Corylus avellana]|uniref:rhodanese-like domain-containing protein 6 isoform X2 n=1 Tax=Corylus avellana TaxID=13451 RepID=UPI00286B0D9A|nr:rhodanese-like domain-containing protein 6 isoform X2 [Corylus avellana]